MSDSFSSATSASSSPFEGQALNPAYMCFGSPPEPVLGACFPKVVIGKEFLDTSCSEVCVFCSGAGFGHFVQELLDDYELGLIRVEFPEGRTLGGLIFVGKGKTLTISFDAHSPTIRKVLRDWKRHQYIQCTFKTDIFGVSFTSPLTNSILNKLLAVKEDKFDKPPTREMVVAMNVLNSHYSKSAQVVTAMLLPCNQNGVVTIRR
ncbi:hypothetical protein [Curvibacter gracilis]|uniref:hypothetical protein n=1 Tax=Curvibacter gracilis TaxID=230310 RepID=UPI0012F84F19|nr:hypothetical protein [Curvibacter gracilis]